MAQQLDIAPYPRSRWRYIMLLVELSRALRGIDMDSDKQSWRFMVLRWGSLPRRGNEVNTQGYTSYSQHLGEDLCSDPTLFYLLSLTMSLSRQSPLIMSEEFIKEKVRLLTLQSDKKDLLLLTSSRHRKRGFLFSSHYGVLKLLYFGFLLVSRIPSFTAWQIPFPS